MCQGLTSHDIKTKKNKNINIETRKELSEKAMYSNCQIQELKLVTVFHLLHLQYLLEFYPIFIQVLKD